MKKYILISASAYIHCLYTILIFFRECDLGWIFFYHDFFYFILFCFDFYLFFVSFPTCFYNYHLIVTFKNEFQISRVLSTLRLLCNTDHSGSAFYNVIWAILCQCQLLLSNLLSYIGQSDIQICNIIWQYSESVPSFSRTMKIRSAACKCKWYDLNCIFHICLIIGN